MKLALVLLSQSLAEPSAAVKGATLVVVKPAGPNVAHATLHIGRPRHVRCSMGFIGRCTADATPYIHPFLHSLYSDRRWTN